MTTSGTDTTGTDATGTDTTGTDTTGTDTTGLGEAVLDEVERAVVGKRAALTLILTTVLAGGHVLIEDLPEWERP